METLDLTETFDLLIQKGLVSSKCVLQKNEENDSCRKFFDLQTLSCSLFLHNSPNEVTDLARICSKFPSGAKL